MDPFQFGKSNSDPSTRISDVTQNSFPLSSSSLPSNGRKWSPPLPLPEALHSEKLDALMFEAMDSNIQNNKSINNINKAPRIRQGKSGRRSWSRASAKEEFRRSDYSFQWSSANFDQFFSDGPKSFKNTSKKDGDDGSEQILKWEPFRLKVVGNGDDRKSVDADIVYSFESKENLDDEFGGSENCNGREKIDIEKPDTDMNDVNTEGFKNKASVIGASQPKSNYTEKVQKFQRDSVYGEKYQGLSDSDYASAGGKGSSGHPGASRSQRRSLMNSSSISSVSDSLGRSSRSRVDNKENAKDNISVWQSVSFGSSSAKIPSVLVQDTNNQVVHGKLQTRGEASVMPSSLGGSTTIEDSSLQGDESLNNVGSSSSNLNIPFQFGAKMEVTKVHNGGRETETKNGSSFNSDRGGYQSHGNWREFLETTSNNITSNNKAPNLEPTSMSSHFQSGFHQSDRYMSSKEAKTAIVNLQTDTDQQMNAANVFTAESPAEEYQFRYDRKDGVERPSFDQQRPFSSSGCSSVEKVRTDKCEGVTNDPIVRVGGSIQKKHTSKPSSAQGSLASGFAGKGHQLVVEGSIKSRSSIDKFESSSFSLQPVIFQTDAAQGYVSGVKGDLFDSNQIAAKEKNKVRFPGRDATSVPDSILKSFNQTAKNDLAATPVAVNNAASEQACQSWRHRGNQAYAEGEFSKAEEYYTRGISCVSQSETSENCIRALVVCYSNLSVTRMAVSRYREALSDCMQALDRDPNFMKARIKAASCHLVLGEYELALAFFKDCLRSQNESQIVDSKLASEALEGMKKTQQVEEKTDHAVRLLSMKDSEDISNSLCLVNEALLISPHSEKLLELKAQALLALRKYEEVIQACEEGLASVNQNHYCGKSASENQIGKTDTNGAQCNCPIKLLLWQMTGKAQFYLGRLEEALASLLKSCGQRMETLTPLIATIRDLLQHKAAGNESFQAGNFVEAEKHYTAALSCNTESRPFTAVCFGNRAAASHAQGHIADAIADCSRAMALDTKYLKAISRRSNLHEMIRNYAQAISDLQRLFTLQESEQRNVKGGSLARTTSSCNSVLDLKGARERLVKAQEDMKKGIPLDQYLILGVEPSCTAAEIKKAYRKAALKHHPDKAAQFLVGSDGGDDELLKECVEEVRRDAEKLFQLIAEAYAILSDPTKRLQYDAEEESQKLRARGTSTAEPGLQSKSSLFEKSNRQHRQGWNAWKDYENQYNHWDAWKDYENQYNHWRTRPDASRTDSCTRKGSANISEGVGWND